MKNKFAILAFIAVISAFSAVSCGNDAPDESSVTLDLPVLTTESTEDTEATTEVRTTAETTVKTTVISETTADTTEVTTKTATETVTESVTAEVTEAPAEKITEPPVVDEPPVTEPPATEPPATEPPVEQVKFGIDNLKNSAVDIVASLGDALDVQNATGCLSNGADQRIYIYDGLSLSCYMDGDTPYIYQIMITNGNYSTIAGITVGSSRSDVENAYGTGEESGNYVIYYDGDKELDIEYNGDTVISIVFYTAV